MERHKRQVQRQERVRVRGGANRGQRTVRRTNEGQQGYPDSERQILTYATTIAIAPSSQIGQYTFRGNSCFDPDYTSGGHQPNYYDNKSAIYSRYRVYASQIIVRAINEQVGSALQVTIIPASDITAFTTSTYPLEHPYARGLALLGVGGLLPAQRTYKMTTEKILGLRGRQILDEDYGASTGSNPTSVWYWQIVAQNLSSEDVMTSMQITIRYDVEFYDRINSTPSTVVKDPEQLPRLQRLRLAHGDRAGEDPQKIMSSVSTLLASRPGLQARSLPGRG